MAGAAAHLSGHFRGTATDGTTLNWVLSLRTQGAITAFGCGYTLHPEAGGRVCQYQTLRGVASLADGTLALVSKPTRADDKNTSEYLFDGVITVTAGDDTATPSISGTWKKKGSADIGLPENAGSFTVKQVPPTSQHNSGLWLGEAVPLDAFAHDTARNPITWALSSRPPEGLEDPAAPGVFGCGFFDDAGDIPGMPVLFYTLQHDGTQPDDDGAGAGAGAGADAAEGNSGGGNAATPPAEQDSSGPASFVKLYEE